MVIAISEFTFEVEEVDKAEFADILRAFKEKKEIL